MSKLFMEANGPGSLFYKIITSLLIFAGPIAFQSPAFSKANENGNLTSSVDTGFIVKLPDSSTALSMTIVDTNCYILAHKKIREFDSPMVWTDTLLLYKVNNKGSIISRITLAENLQFRAPFHLIAIGNIGVLIIFRNYGVNAMDSMILLSSDGQTLSAGNNYLLSNNLYVFNSQVLINSWESPGGQAVWRIIDLPHLKQIGKVELADSAKLGLFHEYDVNVNSHVLSASLVEYNQAYYFKFYLFDSSGQELANSRVYKNIGRATLPYFDQGWLCYDQGILLLDNDLDSVWARPVKDYWYTGWNRMNALDIVPGKDSTFIFGGMLTNPIQVAPYWSKIDKNGKLMYKHLVKANVDYMAAMAPADNGGIYMLQGHSENQTVFLVKTDPDGKIPGVEIHGTGIETKKTQDPLRLIPNPGDDHLEVTWELATTGSLQLIEIATGRLLLEESLMNSRSHMVNTTGFPLGSYKVCISGTFMPSCSTWIKE